ncbi:MAG: hypothetical protein ACP5E9_07690 [Candidatus Methanospirareceae archaeon]
MEAVGARKRDFLTHFLSEKENVLRKSPFLERKGQIKIEAGTIEVRGVRFREYDILNRYKLGKGERESIALAIEMNEDVDFIVTDDRLAYIVMKRMDLNTLLFLDLIVTLVERDMLTREVASGIVRAVESRYPEGFIYHTIKILEMGARRWLS